tara:strand:+ start:141 stop:2144 length:2004 start_codon:yes stop_codon:yes gene_type:complete
VEDKYNYMGSFKNAQKKAEYKIRLKEFGEEKLGYTEPDDWYKISNKFLPNNLLNGFSKTIVMELFPKYDWLPWKFDVGGCIKGLWNSKKIQLKYLKWLGEKLGYTKQEDWYKIRGKDLLKNYGTNLLTKYYKSSAQKIVIELLKSGTWYRCENGRLVKYNEWYEWKFDRVAGDFWRDIKNRKKYVKWLGKKLGYTTLEDWYQVGALDIENNKGGGLLNHYYNSSRLVLLKEIFPDYEWLPWKFTRTIQYFWDDKDNQKTYMKWVGELLGCTTMEDWYKIQGKDFTDNYGVTLLYNYYNGSPIQLLESIFPDYKWLPWCFTIANNGFWHTLENQKNYMDWLGERLGYKTMDDWYAITLEDFDNNYGGGLSTKYSHSPERLLKAIYPNHKWYPWKFGQGPRLWHKKCYQKLFITWLGEELGYTTMEDWYELTHKNLVNNYGNGLLYYYCNSPSKVVIELFPDYKWIPWKFNTVPNGFWKNRENRKKYMVWLGEILEYKKPEDWYQITAKHFEDNYGVSLLNNSHNSRPKHIVVSVFPEYNLKLNKFKFKGYSVGEIRWLRLIMVRDNIHISHAMNDGQYLIPGTSFHADGYCKNTNTIYEYLGDYYHGNPNKYPANKWNKTTMCTMGELHQKNIDREETIKNLGYKVITIWEEDWENYQKMLKKIRKNQ